MAFNLSTGVGVCVSLLGSSVFLLGLNVSRWRRILKIGGPIPTESKNKLFIASRAHSNTVEYVPTIIGLIIWVSLKTNGCDCVYIKSIVYGVTFFRLLLTYGILSSKDLNVPTLPRFLGAVGQYLFGTALAIAAGYVSIAK